MKKSTIILLTAVSFLLFNTNCDLFFEFKIEGNWRVTHYSESWFLPEDCTYGFKGNNQSGMVYFHVSLISLERIKLPYEAYGNEIVFWTAYRHIGGPAQYFRYVGKINKKTESMKGSVYWKRDYGENNETEIYYGDWEALKISDTPSTGFFLQHSF